MITFLIVFWPFLVVPLLLAIPAMLGIFLDDENLKEAFRL